MSIELEEVNAMFFILLFGLKLVETCTIVTSQTGRGILLEHILISKASKMSEKIGEV